MMPARSGEIGVDAVLDCLRFRSRAGWFSLTGSKRNWRESLCFTHDFGPKESVLLRSYFMSRFAMIGVRPEITSTSSSVMVEY
jgi:hypothetical protein